MASYDDVNLILRLYEMRREDKLRAARAWFAANFKVHSVAELNALCPPGSEANAYFRQVVSYWDMVASFITNGVLHEQLFFESGREMLLVWERLRDLVPELRTLHKDPRTWSNLEQVATRFIAWMNTRGPEAYTAFSARIRG